jgi:hypothetical protein
VAGDWAGLYPWYLPIVRIKHIQLIDDLPRIGYSADEVTCDSSMCGNIRSQKGDGRKQSWNKHICVGLSRLTACLLV